MATGRVRSTSSRCGRFDAARCIQSNAFEFVAHMPLTQHFLVYFWKTAVNPFTAVLMLSTAGHQLLTAANKGLPCTAAEAARVVAAADIDQDGLVGVVEFYLHEIRCASKTCRLHYLPLWPFQWPAR